MKTVVRKIVVVMGLVLMGAVLTAVAHGQCATLGRSGAILHHQSWRPGEYNSGSFLLASERSDDDPIVGMWHVKFTAEGNTGPDGPPDGTPIDNAIVQWHPDRTEIMNSGRPAQDGNFCMGVWEKTGKFSYRLNHFALGNDTANAPGGIGNPAGPTRIIQNVLLSPDGNSYAGTFTLNAYSAANVRVAHIVGVISATRITVSTTVQQFLQ